MSACPIEVVALDIYGTVLAFDDHDYSCPPRKGLADFLDNCDRRRIKVVTSSDGFTPNVKNDLLIAFKLVTKRIIDPEEQEKMRKRLCLERFDGFFQMDQGSKDFSVIIGHYDIAPGQLLVIGDNFYKDICGAAKLGAMTIQCPMYGIDQGREWDFAMVDLDN